MGVYGPTNSEFCSIEVSWKGTKAQQKKLDAVQEQVGRKIWEQVEQWHHAQ